MFSTVRNVNAHGVGPYDLQAPGYVRRCHSMTELQTLAYSLGAGGLIRSPFSSAQGMRVDSGDPDAAPAPEFFLELRRSLSSAPCVRVCSDDARSSCIIKSVVA